MKLGAVLRKYRLSREISLREMAKEIGISFPTLGRIENGYTCDSGTFVRIIVWLTSPESGRRHGKTA